VARLAGGSESDNAGLLFRDGAVVEVFLKGAELGIAYTYFLVWMFRQAEGVVDKVARGQSIQIFSEIRARSLGGCRQAAVVRVKEVTKTLFFANRILYAGNKVRNET
jgi:hypothetical protein